MHCVGHRDVVAYVKRVVDGQLREMLGYAGGVLIEGVRGCDKARTAREHAASLVAVDSEDPQANRHSGAHRFDNLRIRAMTLF